MRHAQVQAKQAGATGEGDQAVHAINELCQGLAFRVVQDYALCVALYNKKRPVNRIAAYALVWRIATNAVTSVNLSIIERPSQSILNRSGIIPKLQGAEFSEKTQRPSV